MKKKETVSKQDKEDWQKQRSDFAEKLKGLIEDKHARLFFVMKRELRAIHAHVKNGQPVVVVLQLHTMVDIYGVMSLVLSHHDQGNLPL